MSIYQCKLILILRQWEIACGHSSLVKAAFNFRRASDSSEEGAGADEDPVVAAAMAPAATPLCREASDGLKVKIQTACQRFGSVFLVKITSPTEGETVRRS